MQGLEHLIKITQNKFTMIFESLHSPGPPESYHNYRLARVNCPEFVQHTYQTHKTHINMRSRIMYAQSIRVVINFTESFLLSTPAPGNLPEEIFGQTYHDHRPSKMNSLLDMENNCNPIGLKIAWKRWNFSGLRSLLTKSIVWPTQHTFIFHALRMQDRIAWNQEKILCPPVKTLQRINSWLDFQCFVQDLEHLVKNTIFWNSYVENQN